ncbi:hypothetical protein JL720_3787 [Aureococcus anophagefferens]|nr:hypothetical protein JL720_3787 [Aureococcus anophagefferens]
MLKNADVLEAIDLTVDFFGNEASVAEHGGVLLEVNEALLSLQATLPQGEWWPTTSCMFGMQACLTNAGAEGMSCGQAEAAADDDLLLAGPEKDAADALAACECSLDGASSARAVAADGGATMWVTIDGERYVYEEGGAYGGANTELGFGAWAARVFGVTCQAIVAKGQAAPESCGAYLA